MANLFDYLAWRGDLTVDASPLNEVDSLLLTRFAYLPFDALVTEESLPVPIGSLLKTCMRRYPRHHKAWLMPADWDLAHAMSQSKRFATAQLLAVYHKVREAEAIQFCAMAVAVSPDCLFVLFRGTDWSLVGWKEDLMMTFCDAIPAQQAAAQYAQEIMTQYPQYQTVYIAGHSKGGNLAIFAAMHLPSSEQKKVRAIMNFDGPGFLPERVASAAYQKIKPKIQLYIPQSAVVGRLLTQEGKRIIVSSTQIGLMQHDVYSWDVQPQGLQRGRQLTASSEQFTDNLEQLLAALTPEEREQVVLAIFDALAATGAQTLNDLGDNWYRKVTQILENGKGLSEDTRKLVLRVVRQLASGAIRQAVQDSLPNWPNRKFSIRKPVGYIAIHTKAKEEWDADNQ